MRTGVTLDNLDQVRLDIDLDIEKEEYFWDFLKALLHINPIQIQPLTQEYPFAYEFYHQFRSIIDKKLEELKGQSLYANIILTAEQRKCQPVYNQILQNADTKREFEKIICCAPDIILHRGLDKIEEQIFLCEMKTYINKDWLEDFEKIKKMLSLGFKYYLFLLVGGDKNFFIQELSNMELDKDSYYKDTICICLRLA